MDTLIHCAYDFQAFSWAEIKRTNVEGSLDLLQKAKEAGVPNIVFISTISAFEGCASLYGQAKLEIEQEALKLGALVIRPGLVYGEDSGGIFGKLAGLVKKVPLIPLIEGGRQPLFLIHEEDLARGIYALSQSKPYPQKPITIAFPRSLTLKEILRKIAANHKKRVFFFSIPYFLVFSSLKFLESVGLRPRMKSDSLKGLLNPNPHPDFGLLEDANIPVRKFSASEE